MSKRTPYIRYTSRDFNSIKEDLVNYAKKYYPNTIQDFSEASFGSLLLDTVSYVGDIMSYYLDYSVNESFLDTANEYDNIIKLGKALGYAHKGNVSATGIVTLYISIPANSSGTSINEDYLPTIRRGTTFRSTNGGTFTLIDDVVVTADNSEIRKSRINEKAPFEYVAKTFGKVISGEEREFDYEVGSFEKFKKIRVGGIGVSEVLSVVDSEGNEYHQVDYLSQNVIYRAIPNGNSDKSSTSSILKPYGVIRKFVVIRDSDSTYIQFGGSTDNNVTYKNNSKLDPSNLVINRYGKEFTSDDSFDPTLLVTGDTLGLGPSDTTLKITFRENPFSVTSVPARAINMVTNPIVVFKNPERLVNSLRYSVANSITVVNEYPVNGASNDYTSDEIKTKIYGSFSAQNRAVTEEDYKSLCYNMPGNFGSIKRVSVIRDTTDIKKGLNIYVISEDSYGELVQANNTTKINLKNWLNKSKIISDTIDIIDAKIVNFGIFFSAVVDKQYNKYTVLENALKALKEEFSIKMDIGEYIGISRVYEALRRIDGLIDVREVKLIKKTKRENGSNYSEYSFDFDSNMTQDELFLKVPKNVIMEIKDTEVDIEGKIL